MVFNKNLKSLLTLISLCGFFLNAQAQQQSIPPNPVLEQTNQEKLRELAEQWEAEAEKSLERAKAFAQKHNLPFQQKFSDGTFIEIQGMGPDSLPYYYMTHNQDAAETISTDQVRPGGSLGLNLTGSGFTAGVWDGDAVLNTHQEFGSRAGQEDSETSTSDHATHVAGTVLGAGVRNQAEGMAPQASLDAYDWSFDESEMASAASNGLLISNHSYGKITGFRYNSDSNYWEWRGNPDIDPQEDYRFGFYTSETENWDEIAHNAPFYLIVKSAGNDRNDNGPSGGDPHYIRNDQGDWVESTVNRQPDGNYDCLSPKATAKNVLTVGAVQDISGGYQDPSDVNMSNFSSWGPTDDGRIKPDLVANGVGLYSATDEDDTSYERKSGTSMATPSVTGSLLLLQEHYQDSVSSTPLRAASLKALAIHTADEAGSAPGPDYEHGYGLMNTEKAVNLISDLGENSLIKEIDLSNNGQSTFSVTANANEPLIATICWNDEPGTPPAPQLDPPNKMLVNDLDLRVIDDNSNATQPWVLNPSNPSAPATKGDNARDNVEQVVIENPQAGATYTIEIDHKNQLHQQQDQPVSLVVSGIASQVAPPQCQDTVQIQSNTGIVEDGSQSDLYGNNSDCYWHIQSQNGEPLTLDFLEFSTEQGADSLYIYGGASTQGQMIAAYSGNQVPDSLVTSHKEVFFHFTTDDQIRDKGWKIRFSGYDRMACGAPFFMDYLSEDPAETGLIFQMNANFDQNNVSSAYQVKEVGTAFTDWVSSNEGNFSPDFPIMLDSLRVYVTHENNSGLDDTFQLYVRGLDNNNYPSGPVLWEENIVTNQTLSPSGDWSSGQNILATLTFDPNLVVEEPFFVGLKYKAPLQDTAAILAYHQDVGSGGNRAATESDLGIAYRKHPAFSSNWTPEPDGTEQVFHDRNNNNTYDRGSDEAHFMQVLGLVPIVTEPYHLDTPEIRVDTNNDGTFTLNSEQSYPGYQWVRNDSSIQGANSQNYLAEKDGDYSLTVFDQNGCSAFSDTLNLNCPDLTADFLTTTTNLTIQFSNNSTNEEDVKWYFGDGTTDTNANPTHEYEEEDTYKVCLEVSNQCDSDSTCKTFDLNTTSKLSESAEGFIEIYPNPSSGKFYWELGGLKDEEIAIRVKNVNGKLVLKTRKVGKEGNQDFSGEVDLGHLSKGTYFLEVIHDEGKHTEKLILR